MGRETHSFNYACSCLKSKCRRSCWLDIKASNLSKKVLLHCKNYTSVIKVTNLFLSSSPPPPPPPSLSSLCLSYWLGFDKLHKYHPNGKSASWYRHGTDSCLVGMCFANTHTHARTHTHTVEPPHPSPLRVDYRMKGDGGTETWTSYAGIWKWEAGRAANDIPIHLQGLLIKRKSLSFLFAP